jgi:hypothetical protein
MVEHDGRWPRVVTVLASPCGGPGPPSAHPEIGELEIDRHSLAAGKHG